MASGEIGVLFVCMGNICRSPAAEGVMKEKLSEEMFGHQVNVESCGLGDWHLGQLPDYRMREAAKNRGVLLTSRAQQFKPHFFERFDYILASDQEVADVLYSYAITADQKSKISLMTAYSRCYLNEEVPDPYYRGDGAFEQVLDMLEDACDGLLEEIAKKKIEG